MKALVYTGPESLEYRDAADPTVADGEELVRIEKVGICGSDMHAFLGHDERRPAPLILGHEAAGIITGGPRDGKRVTINPLRSCGTCVACKTGRNNLCPSRQIISMPPREGAFAEWVPMQSDNLVEVPEGVLPEKAALAEPLACGWHAARLAIASNYSGAEGNCLVIGGGAIGVGAALCLAAQGVKDITLVEPNDTRRSYLERTLAFRCIRPEDLNDGDQFDMIVDGVGYAQTRASTTTYARPGGVIAHIGLGSGEGGLDIRRMTLQEITFFGTYAYTAQDFQETAQAIFDGRLGALDWTETRPLSDGARAFTDIRAGTVEAPKIILTP